MAEWGIALSRWGNPFNPGLRPPAPLQQGRDAVTRARTIGLKTGREGAYVDAVSQLYASFETIDQPMRVLAYRDAMARVAAANPNILRSRFLRAVDGGGSTADDRTSGQMKAGALLEKITAATVSGPVALLLHSYDVPSLADRALDRRATYAKVAPSARTRSMPSAHFTRSVLAGIDRPNSARARCEARRVDREDAHMDYLDAYIRRLGWPARAISTRFRR